jgi:hypothetical protein
MQEWNDNLHNMKEGKWDRQGLINGGDGGDDLIELEHVEMVVLPVVSRLTMRICISFLMNN